MTKRKLFFLLGFIIVLLGFISFSLYEEGSASILSRNVPLVPLGMILLLLGASSMTYGIAPEKKRVIKTGIVGKIIAIIGFLLLLGVLLYVLFYIFGVWFWGDGVNSRTRVSSARLIESGALLLLPWAIGMIQRGYGIIWTEMQLVVVPCIFAFAILLITIVGLSS